MFSPSLRGLKKVQKGDEVYLVEVPMKLISYDQLSSTKSIKKLVCDYGKKHNACVVISTFEDNCKKSCICIRVYGMIEKTVKRVCKSPILSWNIYHQQGRVDTIEKD
jgi:hypothetical protein